VTDDVFQHHDGVVDEIPVSLIDDMEFYLLNYFKPGLGRQTADTAAGLDLFKSIGCATCHVPGYILQHDRRVADVRTTYDPANANDVFNRFYAEARPRFSTHDDGTGLPTLKRPRLATFRVENIFTDFKRHDLGPNFHERNFDGSVTTQFLTTALWGVGSTAPYGHDGRSPTLEDVILRHGNEAQAARDAFAQLADDQRGRVLAFLGSLMLFSPPDTASNLEPVDRSNPSFPIAGHGSINLSVLFNLPTDKE